MSNPLIGTVVLTIVSSGGVLVPSAASKVHAAHGPHDKILVGDVELAADPAAD